VTQAQIDALSQGKKDVGNSPLRHRLEQARQQLAEGDVYLQSNHEHLVAPEKMAELLEQVLNQNGRLQLVDLQTLPVAPLVEKVVVKPGGAGAKPASAVAAPDNQLFKHGVKIIVRGSYMDLLQYLAELERLPTQMFWGEAEMKVEKHPEVVLTLTVYTLSLDKTWLKI
jgi:MSHA biogenesis protein MshJ